MINRKSISALNPITQHRARQITGTWFVSQIYGNEISGLDRFWPNYILDYFILYLRVGLFTKKYVCGPFASEMIDSQYLYFGDIRLRDTFSEICDGFCVQSQILCFRARMTSPIDSMGILKS